ncbi:MAG: RecX family transcriptional regulator [Candidatus Omnitrophica bacterium]|nr:RecX family transcriptional regulator [Candidatus Omnitrophota bacterium]
MCDWEARLVFRESKIKNLKSKISSAPQPRTPNPEQTGVIQQPVSEPTEAQIQRLRRFLKAGVRSVREAEAHLGRRGIAPTQARALIAHSRRRGWLDDEACAKLWAVHLADRGYATNAIQARLLAKGLEAALISRTLQHLHLDDDEARVHDAINQLRRPRGGSSSSQDSQRRLASALGRRGFAPDLIARALDLPSVTDD